MANLDETYSCMEPYHKTLADVEVAVEALRKGLDDLPADAPEFLRGYLNAALEATWYVVRNVDHGFIRCPTCGRVSYDRSDVLKAFCKSCDKFHDQMESA
jgi:4-hydroxy-3-methylbut-2-en-1-yl diphosphate synthase IspG/GcpE